MADTITIYVAGFVTDSGTGGFEWDQDRVRIDQLHTLWIDRADADVSDVKAYTLEEIGLDPTFAHTRDAITNALDAAPAMWEPIEGQNR